MQALIEVKQIQRNFITGYIGSTFIIHDNIACRWLGVMDKTVAFNEIDSSFGPAYVFNLKKENGEIIETRYSNTHFLI